MNETKRSAVDKPIGETTGLLVEAGDALGHLENNIAALAEDLSSVSRAQGAEDEPPGPITSTNTSLGNSAQEVLSRVQACNKSIGDLRGRLSI